jgi:phage/plasmid-associated DNA primase
LQRVLIIIFEKKIKGFIIGCETKEAYGDYKKYCEKEGSQRCSHKTFGLRLGRAVNKISTSKNKNP